MNNNKRSRFLRIENLIWLIYIGFAIFGIMANNLEIDDINEDSHKNQKKYKGINIIIFSIAIIIYLFFFTTSFNNYQEKKNRRNLFILTGSTLVLIAGILFLLAELSSTEDNAIVPNE